MFQPTVPDECYNDMTSSGADEKRRGRFTRFLEKRKDTEQNLEPRPQVSATNTDSAYASSENDPTRKGSPDFVPVQNHDISGVDRDRSLWLDKNNGEIYDEDTGDMVTTVTTTTTTTTTTTRGGRRQEAVDVKTNRADSSLPIGDNTLGENRLGESRIGHHRLGENRTAGMIGTMPAKETGGLNEMPAGTVPSSSLQTTTNIPPHRGPSPVPTTATGFTTHDHSTYPTSHTSGFPTRTDSSPPIPSKHPNRVSGEFSRNEPSEYEQGRSSMTEATPISPITSSRPNFSYPSRAGPAASGADEPGLRKSGSTLANLKAAAIAAHGIGETLRGTINDAVDTRLPRSNLTKAEAANAKNQAALARGRTEMETFNTAHRANRPPANTINSGYSNTSNLGHSNTTNLGHTNTSNLAHTNTTDLGRTDTQLSTSTMGRTTTPLTSSNDMGYSGTPYSNATHAGATGVGNSSLTSGTATNPGYRSPAGTGIGTGTGVGIGTGTGTGPGTTGHTSTATAPRVETEAPATETKSSSGFSKLFKRKPISGEPQSQGQQSSRFY